MSARSILADIVRGLHAQLLLSAHLPSTAFRLWPANDCCDWMPAA